MTDVLGDLIDLLDLQAIEKIVIEERVRIWAGDLVGGHVLAQALEAAAQTVEGDGLAHSLHAYFLRTGAVDAPIEYVGTASEMAVASRLGGSLHARMEAIFNLAVIPRRRAWIRTSGPDAGCTGPGDLAFGA